MLEHDPEVARAGDSGGVDELAFAQGEEVTADESRQAGPEDRAEDESEHRASGARDELAEDGADDDDGKDDEAVGNAHEQ
ncbi:Uncharacterised protein [Mycobacteroides abscessus subsp. abscessus]|nr:Uncharacterised protein [Mycobacteroides abscessus subsp. abscessus]